MEGPLLQVVMVLLEDLKRQGGVVSDDALLKLHFIFGQTLQAALDIVDRNRVARVTAIPSRRSCFQIQGIRGSGKETETTYTCFEHYCTCRSFLYSVVVRSELLFVCLIRRGIVCVRCGSHRQQCKHQLAAFLANALNKIRQKEMDDLEYAQMLLAAPTPA